MAETKRIRLIAWIAYPVTVTSALILHEYLYTFRWPLLFGSFVPLIFGAAAVTFLERKYPYRCDWFPDSSDIKNDAFFMVFVQAILPKLLSFCAAFLLLTHFNRQDGGLNGYWPYDYPRHIQALLMLFSADFLRYWLHRISHEWYPLWRLHAVHHSPHKLYWLNVGRFHPGDKTLQFIFDSLPFLLLGISEEVLAIYFVFYGINGFFQHCNINLRLGFLNYVISGPELHRWHHSFVIKEANKNYGNNLIIWDLLFGTWFLPSDREIEKLGLKNRAYPLDFVNQLGTPFIKNIDQNPE